MLPLTRRQCLAASLGSFAAWTMGSFRLRAADRLQPFSFVIVSDTHLGRGDSVTPERQWRAAIAEINAGPGDFVLHLGDVVDGGRAPQYPIYAASKQDLTKPIHEIPGNHDPTALFEKHIRTPVDIAFDHAGVRFLLFDNAHRDSHMGFLSPEQLAWISEQCDDAADRELRIAFCCHVPIHANKHPDRGWYVLPSDGQQAFYELINRHTDRVLTCFHGHFHNGIRGWRDQGQVVEVLCPSVCYNQDRQFAENLHAGKIQGFSVNEFRPGYVLATLGGGRLILRYKPLGAEMAGEYVADWG